MTLRTPRGFTLIELLIGLAIAVIVLILALPNYGRWVGDANIQSGASSIAEGLRLAQAMAIQRNTNIEFTLNSGAGWSVQAPGGAALKVGAFSDGAKLALITPDPATSTTVTFNFLGQVAAQNAAAPTNPFTQVDVDAPARNRPLRVLVGGGSTGIKVCDPKFPYDLNKHPDGCP